MWMRCLSLCRLYKWVVEPLGSDIAIGEKRELLDALAHGVSCWQRNRTFHFSPGSLDQAASLGRGRVESVGTEPVSMRAGPLIWVAAKMQPKRS